MGCRLPRLYPWPSAEELNEYYPAGYWFVPGPRGNGQLQERYRRWVLSDHVRFVQQSLAAAETSGPVLDVGCGGGLFGRMLAEKKTFVAGLDFSALAAAAAWRVNGVPAVCGVLSSAPFRAGSCRAITMFHVLEHLYDPASYLHAAHDLLAAGGRLIVQVPDASCWQFFLLGERWNGIDIPRHLIDFRSSDLTALLRHCGFAVVRQKHFSWRDNPAGLASTLAPWLDPMARRIRNVRESGWQRLLKDLVYLSLVMASVPFTILEAACRAGSTVMIEARKMPA